MANGMVRHRTGGLEPPRIAPYSWPPLPQEKSPMLRLSRAAFAMALSALFTTGLFAAGLVAALPAHAQTPVTTPSGLTIIDTKVGTGAAPKLGQTVVVHYTGWLYQNGAKGMKFDSSRDRNEPFAFQLGAHLVIAGWDEGLKTMKVGGKRTLIIPPELGYGSRGAGADIPPNATLMFDVELLDIKK
jgi:peptidylprolyl isomerase